MDLPGEMWLDILLHLPVKSLLQLKSVCKSWCALIDSPQFKAIYLSRAKNYALLLKRPPLKNTNRSASYYIHSNLEPVRDATKPDLQHMPFSRHANFFGDTVMLICDCNGLIFLEDDNGMYLLNPALQEVRILPPLPRSSFIGCYLGLGYDSNANDYKVVILGENQTAQMANVYSLNSDSWREIVAQFPTCVLDERIFPVYFNGCMHWSACTVEFDPTSPRVARRRRRVVLFSFDMSTEVVKEIALPDSFRGENIRPPRLGVLRESLALIYRRYVGLEDRIDVWVMKEYGVKETWTKMYSIGPGFDNVFCLCFWKDELLLQRCVGGQLILTLISLAAGHKFRTFDGYGEYDDSVVAIVYKESWISVKRCHECLGFVQKRNKYFLP
nr:F-box/kelch-repeat protein At3g23880-like isoform X1 [Coffea arabica]XP_027095599.1 F-box/kelch-repeat protein At3g23880-like isoform X1 [Coffea arabica]XP_027095600.1 F-box/kelch-repeat protein At3g23880-like isoform X1 [Coffea arabica]